MDVYFRVGRDIDIDDRFKFFDIQAARRHIGRHQHRATAIGKLDQHLVAFALFHVAVQGQRLDAPGMQHFQQRAALLFGVAERQGGDRPVVF